MPESQNEKTLISLILFLNTTAGRDKAIFFSTFKEKLTDF